MTGNQRNFLSKKLDSQNPMTRWTPWLGSIHAFPTLSLDLPFKCTIQSRFLQRLRCKHGRLGEDVLFAGRHHPQCPDAQGRFMHYPPRNESGCPFESDVWFHVFKVGRFSRGIRLEDFQKWSSQFELSGVWLKTVRIIVLLVNGWNMRIPTNVSLALCIYWGGRN